MAATPPYGPPPGSSGPPPVPAPYGPAGAPGSAATAPPAPVGPPQAPAGPPVPAPPRGPGVRVPFLAPPKVRNNRRLTVTVLVGVLVLVVCGAGALVGAVGLVNWINDEVNAMAEESAADFMDAVTEGRYGDAYDSLCPPALEQIGPVRFESEWRWIAPVGSGYALEDPLAGADGLLYVPVRITPAVDDARVVHLYMEQEPAEDAQDEAHMAVCGWELGR